MLYKSQAWQESERSFSWVRLLEMILSRFKFTFLLLSPAPLESQQTLYHQTNFLVCERLQVNTQTHTHKEKELTGF